MGEYANYMLSGDDCCVCGEHIGSGDGFPRTCAGCSRPDRPAARAAKSAPVKHCACATCGKRFRSWDAVRDHDRDAHKAVPAGTGDAG